MTNWPVHAAWNGPIVMIGFGSIGRGTLPLILRHIGFDRSRMVVIAPDDSSAHIAQQARDRPPAKLPEVTFSTRLPGFVRISSSRF